MKKKKHAQLYEDQDIPVPETFDDDYKNRGTAAHDQEMTIERHLTPTDLKRPIPPGLEISIGHRRFTSRASINPGHKIALTPIDPATTAA